MKDDVLKKILITNLFLFFACGAVYYWRGGIQNLSRKFLDRNSAAVSSFQDSVKDSKLNPKTEMEKYPLNATGINVPKTVSASIQSELKDQSIYQEFSKLLSSGLLDLILDQDNLLQRFVVTVNSLPERHLPLDFLPLQLPKGNFIVVKDSSGTLMINSNNFKRYARYVELLEIIDNQKLVEIYRSHYREIQAAYREINPKGYFNDRLVTVVDHVLSTPVVEGPIFLDQPSHYYEYADINLERLSSVQRILIHMGIENENRIKSKLQRLRSLLVQR